MCLVNKRFLVFGRFLKHLWYLIFMTGDPMHFLNSEYFKKDCTFFWSESQDLVQRELLCFALEYMYGGSLPQSVY